MEARLARLESDVGHLRTDVADIKTDVRSLRDKMDAMTERFDEKFEAHRPLERTARLANQCAGSSGRTTRRTTQCDCGGATCAAPPKTEAER